MVPMFLCELRYNRNPDKIKKNSTTMYPECSHSFDNIGKCQKATINVKMILKKLIE